MLSKVLDIGNNMNEEDLEYRLRKRAEIRRQILTRKSVMEGTPDRIADLLEEAAAELNRLKIEIERLGNPTDEVKRLTEEVKRLNNLPGPAFA